MKSDSRKSNSLNVSVNQTIKLAPKKHQYYRWVCTNGKLFNSATHWRAWVPLKVIQAIEQCICEKVVWLVEKESAKALNFAIVQNHWVAPRWSQPFIFPRSIKWVPGISGNLVVKSELPPQSGSSLEAVEPHS